MELTGWNWGGGGGGWAGGEKRRIKAVAGTHLLKKTGGHVGRIVAAKQDVRGSGVARWTRRLT